MLHAPQQYHATSSKQPHEIFVIPGNCVSVYWRMYIKLIYISKVTGCLPRQHKMLAATTTTTTTGRISCNSQGQRLQSTLRRRRSGFSSAMWRMYANAWLSRYPPRASPLDATYMQAEIMQHKDHTFTFTFKFISAWIASRELSHWNIRAHALHIS